jgi:hypothetical protein
MKKPAQRLLIRAVGILDKIYAEAKNLFKREAPERIG